MQFNDLGVRIGQPEEVHEIMDLALAACSENGFANPNPVKLLGQIWSALNLDNGIMGIIGEPGKLEGGILLRVADVWYSDDRLLEEKAIFIHPDYRSAKGGRARRLCEFAKRASVMLEVPLLIGVLSNDRTRAKVRLYERQFGDQTGAFFLYNGRTGSVRTAAE